MKRSLTALFFALFTALLVVSCNHNNDTASGGGGGAGGDTGNGTGGGSGLLGTWNGSWTNTTFGTSGPLSVTVVDNGNGTYNVTVDLGGMVGGMIDPPPQTVTATVDGNGGISFNGNVSMLGQLIFSVSSGGTLSISAPAITTPGFSSFSASGSISATTGSLNYTVIFTGGGSANGTATATKS
jgi:hypothetical protein